ncbi:MAG TPA: tetratricopeptide repeat protein, partial [Candidatus Goldiibacteriota bacterium]|nr:tetratricopeptide repeat protein [Candidatus Goldiibacteriota bacterium]
MRKTLLLTGFLSAFSALAFASSDFNEGNKLYLNGKYNEALGQYQNFLKNEPDRYEGYFNAGNALFRQEQYDQALGMYKKAQELNPKDPDIQHNIEVTNEKIRQKAENKGQQQNQQNQNQQDKKQSGESGSNSQQGQKQGGNQQQADQEQGKEKQENRQQGSQGQQSAGQQSGADRKPPSGMTPD